MTDVPNGPAPVDQTTGQLVKALLGSVVRHSVAAIAVYFASKGILQPGQEGSFTDLISGATVAAVMLFWSVLQKFAKHAQIVGLKQAFYDYVKAVQQGDRPAQAKAAAAITQATKQ